MHNCGIALVLLITSIAGLPTVQRAGIVRLVVIVSLLFKLSGTASSSSMLHAYAL